MFLILFGIVTLSKVSQQENESSPKLVTANSVKTLGDYAFNECTNLKEITIPSSVTNIGESAFRSNMYIRINNLHLTYCFFSITCFYCNCCFSI